jgi:uncharacterized protein
VLLIGASRDTDAPPAVHHQPLVDAWLAHSVDLQQRIFATDHALADHRVALTRTVLAFLAPHVREPR